MNERIRELAWQAANGMLSYDAEGDFRLSEKEVEKFAELIVRECCDVLYDNEMGGYRVNHVLKEYFGIEMQASHRVDSEAANVEAFVKKYMINEEGRVVALRDFGDVKVGDVGGFVWSEKNLSHEGNCWIYENAQVCENAWVFGNAQVCGNARVCGNAQVYENAQVCRNAQVFGNVQVFGNARVYENAQVCGEAQVFGNAQVYGEAQVCENAWVYENAQVCRNAQVFGNAQVYGEAQVCENAWVFGNAQVCGNARVCGNAQVYGEAHVYGVMRSDGFSFCYVSCADREHRVIAGCRYFTMPEAREHWGTEHPKHEETCVILDALERLSKVREEGCV